MGDLLSTLAIPLAMIGSALMLALPLPFPEGPAELGIPTGRVVIHVLLDGGLPAAANSDEDLGTVEVSIGGQFVGSLAAAYTRPDTNQVLIVPQAVSWVAYGLKDEVEVEVTGELGRLVKPIVTVKELAR